MKKIVSVQEVDGEGLVGLMGQRVTLFCANYIYTGNLTGVNDTCVLLEDAGIVYETGSFSEKNWKDYQRVADKIYVTTQSIEMFAVAK
jgi:hypothetical protein